MVIIHHASADERYFGIDVSQHQGYIDWDTVAQNVDFVLIRCGFGGDYTQYDDARWEYNVSSCERLGIPYGVYLYSYMETEDEALGEAAHTLRLLSGHHPALPVYLDLEDSTVGGLSNEKIVAYTNIWLSKILAAGYQAGVYANYNWWSNRLGGFSLASEYKWLAAWSSGYESIAKGYAVWQYTNNIFVPGISGAVDGNYCWDLGRWIDTQPTLTVEPTATPTPTPTATVTPMPTATPTVTPRPSPTVYIHLPNDLATIEPGAFEHAGAEAVIVPENVSWIGSRAFADNPGLLSITIYSRSIYLAPDIFAGSSNVIISGYTDTPVEWYAIAKGIPFVELEE